MLSVNNLDDFVSIIGEDINMTNLVSDSDGDIIGIFDPDKDFSSFRDHILSNRRMRDSIVDSGVNFVEVAYDIYVNGNKVNIHVLSESGDNGFGTSVKMNVKTVDVLIGGEVKRFLGFSSYKAYKNRNVR